jgi:hypothetical protein
VKARQALDRTVLLAQDLIGPGRATDEDILGALLSTQVLLVSDLANLESAAGQSCLVTLAQLVLEMGCRLFLSMPEVRIVAPQPPLRGEWLRAGLIDLAANLIPGATAAFGSNAGADLVFVLGDSAWAGNAKRAWRLEGGPWWGAIGPVEQPAQAWSGDFPVGALKAAAAAAVEPFKFAISRLISALGLELGTPELVEETRAVRFDAAAGSREPLDLDLGRVDLISGGAITMACLHALFRVPGLCADLRVIEPELLDMSNLNRYALARREFLNDPKGLVMQRWQTSEIRVSWERQPFDERTLSLLAPLDDWVLVGCDDIATRWLVQSLRPSWLGVGSTANFHTLTSEHTPGEPCARCLHSRDDQFRGVIPTVSFVSYWAGLLLAERLLRAALGAVCPPELQALNLVPLRLDLPGSAIWGRVPRLPNCPNCQAS